MPQDSVSSVQHSAVFITSYTNSRNSFEGEQGKFRVLKSNIQSPEEMSRKSTNSHPVTHRKNGIVVQDEANEVFNGYILNTRKYKFVLFLKQIQAKCYSFRNST